MKTLLILLTTILLVSCNRTSNKVDAEYNLENNPTMSIEKIDKCEYVKYIGNNIIHKENCNNPIHNNIKPRDYQLELTTEYCYIYDGNRLVGKCPMKDNMIEQLITIDNQ